MRGEPAGPVRASPPPPPAAAAAASEAKWHLRDLALPLPGHTRPPRASRLQDGGRGRGRPAGGGGKEPLPHQRWPLPGILSAPPGGASRAPASGRACAERRSGASKLYGRPLAQRFRRARGVVGDRRAPLRRRRRRAEEREPRW